MSWQREQLLKIREALFGLRQQATHPSVIVAMDAALDANEILLCVQDLVLTQDEAQHFAREGLQAMRAAKARVFADP